MKKTTEQFIREAKLIHNNKYDYSLTDYKGNKNKVKIICSVHGIFEQIPINHLKGKGCPKCANNIKITNEEFIRRAKLIHGNRYDYSKINYINNYTKVEIICFIHGAFKQAPYHHLQGSGCPLCKSSVNERRIEKILNDYNIDFKREFRFDSCRDRRTLPFDFYLPKFNVCIEYDGQQHFRPTDFKNYNHITEEAKNSFGIIKKHDKIKTDFCNSNNIKLVRISYKDNIVEKLNFLLE